MGTLRLIGIEIKRHPVPSYFVLTFLISWAIGILLVASYNGLLSLPMWLHYFIALGPFLAAVIVTSVISGRAGLTDIGARIIRRPRSPWALLSILALIVLAVTAGGVSYLLNGVWPDFDAIGSVEYLGDIGIVFALLLWLATFGFGEEIGWRGFALDKMLKEGHSVLKASLIIGPLWALWHVPAFFYKPTLMSLGAVGFVGFSVGVISGSVLLAWLYTQSRSSILAVALWHATFDLLTTANTSDGFIAAVLSTFVMVWAVLIAVWYIMKGRSQHSLTKRGRLAYTGTTIK